jgi:hypothetical protein
LVSCRCRQSRPDSCSVMPPRPPTLRPPGRASAPESGGRGRGGTHKEGTRRTDHAGTEARCILAIVGRAAETLRQRRWNEVTPLVLFIPGKTQCVLCGISISDEQEVIGFPAFLPRAIASTPTRMPPFTDSVSRDGDCAKSSKRSTKSSV